MKSTPLYSSPNSDTCLEFAREFALELARDNCLYALSMRNYPVGPPCERRSVPSLLASSSTPATGW